MIQMNLFTKQIHRQKNMKQKSQPSPPGSGSEGF